MGDVYPFRYTQVTIKNVVTLKYYLLVTSIHGLEHSNVQGMNRGIDRNGYLWTPGRMGRRVGDDKGDYHTCGVYDTLVLYI